MKRNLGITLIALVVTIIVLLILAGITINLLFSENGIIEKAKEAKNKTEESIKDEYNELNSIDAVIENELNSEENNEKFLADGNWNEEKGVNTPKIEDGMTLVTFDDEKQEWVKDETNKEYEYTQDGNSKWANARVTINGVSSYFVWIPRYEYICNSEEKEIKIKFIPTSQIEPDEGYTIHPAFRDGTSNNYSNGEWNSELSGIWVSKYEASYVNGTDISDNIQIVPGVSPITNVRVGQLYQYGANYNPERNSHMMKNSEWGAVAYLTYSSYGKNKVEIESNGIRYTGGGQDKAYIQKVSQSTTGNVYGIYDLSGCCWEYTSSYYYNPDEDKKKNGIEILEEKDKKLVTEYRDINNGGGKKGDATTETRNWYGEENKGGDYCFPIYGPCPYMIRGGSSVDGTNSGIFAYGNYGGEGTNDASFRICLIIN